MGGNRAMQHDELSEQKSGASADIQTGQNHDSAHGSDNDTVSVQIQVLLDSDAASDVDCGVKLASGPCGSTVAAASRHGVRGPHLGKAALASASAAASAEEPVAAECEDAGQAKPAPPPPHEGPEPPIRLRRQRRAHPDSFCHGPCVGCGLSLTKGRQDKAA